MHDFRSAVLSGEGLRPNGPLATKKKKAAEISGSLAAIAVKRQESRVHNQRSEDRHRGLIEDAVIHFRRKKYDVPVINVSSGGVMIHFGGEPKIGERIDIQFAECNRTKCVVRWIRDDRIGLEFHSETGIIGSPQVQDYIVRKLRGEPEQEAVEASASAAAKRAPRHGLIWMGTLHCNHDSIPVRLRNISADGAMVETEHDFPVGQEVLLDLEEGGTAFAKIRWNNGGQLGLRFDHKFDLKRLADAKPVPVPPKVVKPAYLQSDGKADSPWSAMWDRLTITELNSTLKA